MNTTEKDKVVKLLYEKCDLGEISLNQRELLIDKINKKYYMEFLSDGEDDEVIDEDDYNKMKKKSNCAHQICEDESLSPMETCFDEASELVDYLSKTVGSDKKELKDYPNVVKPDRKGFPTPVYCDSFNGSDQY
jgi:hypothetical protein